MYTERIADAIARVPVPIWVALPVVLLVVFVVRYAFAANERDAFKHANRMILDDLTSVVERVATIQQDPDALLDNLIDRTLILNEQTIETIRASGIEAWQADYVDHCLNGIHSTWRYRLEPRPKGVERGAQRPQAAEDASQEQPAAFARAFVERRGVPVITPDSVQSFLWERGGK